ncbi:MAG: aldose 1-epimerase family protein [Clostridia bacterium]|nr:aldose 1-epimerase family protein [Clostridia bacterium]
MRYTIENEHLKVEIADLGAELMSVVGKKTGFEYLWQGNPEYWKNRATVPFPICGRVFEGKYTWRGQEYEMILHGFAKLQTYRVVEQKPDSITFELTANEETRKCYPFEFILRLTYSLDGATVRTGFYVENVTEEDLPFSIGGHPGFNVPFVEGEAFEDYYLAFACEKPARQRINSATCFFTGETKPFALREGKYLDLRRDLFDNDAVFLQDACKKVSLCSRKNDRAVTVSYYDIPYLGLWQKPHSDAGYVCIEPWNGYPSFDGKVDDFATKADMMHLAKGETYTGCFDITITE